MIELTQEQLQKLKVIENAVMGRVSIQEAARLLGVSGRQVRSQKALPATPPQKQPRRQESLLAPFDRLQIDVKDLIDRPAYQPFIRQAGFPRLQFTGRLRPRAPSGWPIRRSTTPPTPCWLV